MSHSSPSAARKVHPGDENIGLDASVSRLGGGKKQFLELMQGMKLQSQVTIPLHAKFIGVDLPARHTPDPREAHFSPAHHMWRAYRGLMLPPGDSRTEGKKMFASKTPTQELEATARQSLRHRVRAMKQHEDDLRRQLADERAKRYDAHRQKSEIYDKVFHLRCKVSGLEGLERCSLRSPDPLPELPADMSEADLLRQSIYPSREGKKMVPKAEMHSVKLPPFGAPLAAASPSLVERWDLKTLS